MMQVENKSTVLPKETPVILINVMHRKAMSAHTYGKYSRSKLNQVVDVYNGEFGL